MIEKIDEYRKEYQRDHLPFEYQAMSTDAYTADGIKRLRDLRVTEVLVAFRDVYRKEPDDNTVQQTVDGLKWLRDEVIDKSQPQVKSFLSG